MTYSSAAEHCATNTSALARLVISWGLAGSSW
jgi:hypothetical protein